jgi:hypothetical protein
MNSLPSTRTRRRTAFAILFVWAFALVSGAANACLLDAHGLQKHDLHLPQSEAHDLSRTLLDAHAEGHLSHDDEPDAARQACLKVCDGGSQSLLMQSSSADLADPGLAPFIAATWTVAMRVQMVPSRPNDVHLHFCGPPLRVRLSRLAL